MESSILDVAAKMSLAIQGTPVEQVIVAALVIATATSAQAGLSPEELKSILENVIDDNYANYLAAVKPIIQ
jgi:hypothetical protein